MRKIKSAILIILGGSQNIRVKTYGAAADVHYLRIPLRAKPELGASLVWTEKRTWDLGVAHIMRGTVSQTVKSTLCNSQGIARIV